MNQSVESSNEIVNREELIIKLIENLPLLRVKIGISQAELADLIGIGRQTILAIENRKSKMRWDTFLAIILVFSKNEKTTELMRFLELHINQIEGIYLRL